MPVLEKTSDAPHSHKSREIKPDAAESHKTTFDHTKVMLIYVLGGPGAGTTYQLHLFRGLAYI